MAYTATACYDSTYRLEVFFNSSFSPALSNVSWRIVGIGVAALALVLAYAAKRVGLFSGQVVEGNRCPILQKISQIVSRLFNPQKIHKPRDDGSVLAVTNPSSVAPVTPLALTEGPLIQLDTLGQIFYFLSLSDLINVATVCKKWALVVTNPDLWKNLLANQSTTHRLVDNFSPYVKKEELTWKEAFHFAELMVLLNRILEDNFPDQDFFIKENPELKNEPYPYSIMRQPRISYGNIVFSIFNAYDVKVQVKGEEAFKVLKGEKGKMLTHLAVENEFLFALRNDGVVVQFNLGTEEQKSIPSSWALNKIPNPGPTFKCWSPFLVENGYIVMKYGDRVGKQVFEVIPYRNPEFRKVVIDHRVDNCRRFVVKQKRVYLGGLGVDHIFSMNLTAPREIKIYKLDPGILIAPSREHDVRDIAICSSIFCVSDLCGLYLIDTKTQKFIKKPGLDLKQIIIIENLLFGALYKKQQKTGSNQYFSTFTEILVYDLNTGHTITEVQDILNTQFTEITPTILPRLVQICRQHCKAFVPPSSFTQPSTIDWLWQLIKRLSPF